jgi:Tfp pilus assembly protein PilN
MIKINLLPIECRKANKKASPIPYLPLIILGSVLFLLLTLFFYVDYLSTRTAYVKVRKEWIRLSPLMAQLKSMENKVDVEMKGEKAFLEANVLNTQPITRILMWASEFLPPRCWLTNLEIERQGEGSHLELEGVVFPSNNRTGIEHIEGFLNKLKMQLSTATLTLTTSKTSTKDVEGTSFVAHFEWGMVKKS